MEDKLNKKKYRKKNVVKGYGSTKKTYKNKAFTLIEVIITIIVIGVLVLLGTPKFLNYVDTAKLTQIKNDTKVVENMVLQLETEEMNGLDKDIFTDKITDKGISKDSTELKNTEQGVGKQIRKEYVKDLTTTRLNKDNFYFNEKDRKVFYYYDKKGVSNEVKEEPKEEYKVAEEGIFRYRLFQDNTASIEGFNDKGLEIYKSETKLSEDFIIPDSVTIEGEDIERTIIGIEDDAFKHYKFEKELVLPTDIKYIGKSAFYEAIFKGEFKTYKNLEVIGDTAFYKSMFVGPFKQPSLKYIGIAEEYKDKFINVAKLKPVEVDYFTSSSIDVAEGAFKMSNFDDLYIPNIVVIGPSSFEMSFFSNLKGIFPTLDKVEYISEKAFNSMLIIKMPYLENLLILGKGNISTIDIDYYDVASKQVFNRGAKRIEYDKQYEENGIFFLGLWFNNKVINVEDVDKILKEQISLYDEALEGFTKTSFNMNYSFMSKKWVEDYKKINSYYKPNEDITYVFSTHNGVIDGKNIKNDVRFEDDFRTINKTINVVSELIDNSSFKNDKDYKYNTILDLEAKKFALSPFDQTSSNYNFVHTSTMSNDVIKPTADKDTIVIPSVVIDPNNVVKNKVWWNSISEPQDIQDLGLKYYLEKVKKTSPNNNFIVPADRPIDTVVLALIKK